MKIIILIIAATIFGLTVALAQLPPSYYSPMIPNGSGPMVPYVRGPMVPGSGPMVTNASAGVPSGCSNKLDFMQVCNSQYIGVF